MLILRHVPPYPKGVTLRKLKRTISAHRFGHELTEHALRNLAKADMIVQTPGERKGSTLIARPDDGGKK